MQELVEHYFQSKTGKPTVNYRYYKQCCIVPPVIPTTGAETKYTEDPNRIYTNI